MELLRKVKQSLARLLLVFLVVAGFSISASGNPLAPCNASFTACSIAENVLLQLPFSAIAGDVIVLEPSSSRAVSDVFRIFNNLVDTSGGTGLGNQVFLYSLDDGPLPNPSTYSVNAITISEPANGNVSFDGNGTAYTLETGSQPVPEPASVILFATALIGFGVMRRRRRVS